VAAQVIGRGVEDGVTVGPMIDQAAITKIDELVADAVDKGGKVILGGRARAGAGFFHTRSPSTPKSAFGVRWAAPHTWACSPGSPASVFLW
jgi:aldehyde dehydrogenase family protein